MAFFSTGDELQSIGPALGEGEIYDSNRYTIHGMLTRLGCDVLDMGVVRDDPALLESGLPRSRRESPTSSSPAAASRWAKPTS